MSCKKVLVVIFIAAGLIVSCKEESKSTNLTPPVSITVPQSTETAEDTPTPSPMPTQTAQPTVTPTITQLPPPPPAEELLESMHRQLESARSYRFEYVIDGILRAENDSRTVQIISYGSVSAPFNWDASLVYSMPGFEWTERYLSVDVSNLFYLDPLDGIWKKSPNYSSDTPHFAEELAVNKCIVWCADDIQVLDISYEILNGETSYHIRAEQHADAWASLYGMGDSIVEMDIWLSVEDQSLLRVRNRGENLFSDAFWVVQMPLIEDSDFTDESNSFDVTFWDFGRTFEIDIPEEVELLVD